MTKRKFIQGLMGAGLLMGTGIAYAQEPKINFPAEGQDVRGEIIVTWQGVPEGGYAMVFVNGQLRTATAETSLTLNTLPPNFPADGPLTVTVRGINSAGRRTGETKVTFNIANNKVDTDAEEVRLLVWKPEDRLLDVQRYRIFAESNATISDGGASGGGASGGGSSGGGGGDGGGAEYIPAPLDWQMTALLRSVVRDVGMIDGSANIRTVVDHAFQRQRQSEYGGGAGGESGGSGGGGSTKKKSSKAPAFPTKAPWHYDEEGPLPLPLWEQAPETGTYFVKMVQQTGDEINATRKPTTIAIADLLPTFPKGAVKPGITWTTTMTFLSDLSNRKPINVEWRMLFTTFETIKTPAQREIRAAKLESRFQMPSKQAMDIALSLAAMSGAGGGSGGGGSAEGGSSSGGSSSSGRGASGGASAGGGDAGGAGVDPDTIKNARTNVARVLWFDIENRRVLRCEDRLNTYFEMESQGGAGGEGGGSGASSRSSSSGSSGGASGEGGAQAPAEPTRVSYSLFVSTVLDDTIPEPSTLYDRRRFIPTGHVDASRNPDDITKPNNRDRTLVRDPSIDKALIPSR